MFCFIQKYSNNNNFQTQSNNSIKKANEMLVNEINDFIKNKYSFLWTEPTCSLTTQAVLFKRIKMFVNE